MRRLRSEKKRDFFAAVFVILCVTGAGAGCAQEDTGAADMAPQEGTAKEELPTSPPQLPVTGSDGNCSRVFPFSLCGWAAGVDAIVFGTIAELQPVQDVFVSGGGLTSVRADGLCSEGYLVPSFDITLKAVETPWGSPQESVVVRVPALEVGEWNPMVLIDPATGSVDWRGGAPLEVGQRVGVSLVYVDEAKLWMAKGPLLAVWADEAADTEFLTAQDWNECIAGPTLNGLSMKEFGETLANCDPLDATVALQSEEFRGYDDDWFSRATPDELIWRLGSQCSVVDMNAPVCTTEEECANLLAP